MKLAAAITAVTAVAIAISACGSTILSEPNETTSTSSTSGAGGMKGTTSTSTKPTTTTTTTTTTTWSEGTTTTWCGDWNYSNIAACQGCVEWPCCTLQKDCAASQACRDMVSCLLGCTGAADEVQTCIDGCTSAAQASDLAAAQALIACAGQFCGAAEGCPTAGLCTTSFKLGDPKCETCAHTQCCDALHDCAMDPGLPGEPTCGECLADVASALDACYANPGYQAVLSCADALCADACFSQGICDSGLATNHVACDGCLSAVCCDAINACVQDDMCLSDCVAYGVQIPECNDPSTPQGALYQPLKGCWNTHCSGPTACGGELP